MKRATSEGTFLPKDATVEQKEQPAKTAEIMTPQQLEEIIFDEYGDAKPRFARHDEGGVFKLFFPEDTYDRRLVDRILYAVAKEGDLIVGIGKLTRSQQNENRYEIDSVSVDPDYQNQGHSKRIVEEFFKQAQKHGWELEATPYTKEGWRGRRALRKIAECYNVTLIDREEKWGWYEDNDEK